jgi:hypothetical protein
MDSHGNKKTAFAPAGILAREYGLKFAPVAHAQGPSLSRFPEPAQSGSGSKGCPRFHQALSPFTQTPLAWRTLNKGPIASQTVWAPRKSLL